MNKTTLNNLLKDFETTDFWKVSLKRGMFVISEYWKTVDNLIERYDLEIDIQELIRFEELLLLELRKFMKGWLEEKLNGK